MSYILLLYGKRRHCGFILPESPLQKMHVYTTVCFRRFKCMLICRKSKKITLGTGAISTVCLCCQNCFERFGFLVNLGRPSLPRCRLPPFILLDQLLCRIKSLITHFRNLNLFILNSSMIFNQKACPFVIVFVVK